MVIKPVKKKKDVLKEGQYLGKVKKVEHTKNGIYVTIKIGEPEPPPMIILPPRKRNSPIFRHYGGKK